MLDAGHQLQWRPLGPVEHVVIDGEVAVLPNPQDVEGGGHGAFAGRQDRPWPGVGLCARSWGQTGAQRAAAGLP